MKKNELIKKDKVILKKKKPRKIQKKMACKFPSFFFDGEKSIQMFRAAIISFSILVGAGSFYLAHEANYYAQEAELLRHARNEKIDWMKEINKAILNMREQRLEIVRECTYGTPLPMKEQEALRETVRFKFMRSYVGARFIFNDKLRDKARELIQFDFKIKDVCAPNAPDDKAWKEYMWDLDEIMGISLQEEATKLEYTNKKISEVEETPFIRFLWPY